MKAPGIAIAGELLDVAATGIGEPEQLCNLVERFTRRVVPGSSEQTVSAPRLDIQQQGVAARDEQRRERRYSVAMLERRREEMPLHVMDAEQRDVAREGERLAVADSDEQRADESRRVGDGDSVQIIESRPGFFDCPLDHRHNAGEMRARSDLGNHSSKHPMNVLRENDE